MKKLIALLLTMIMVLSLAACGEKTPAGNAVNKLPGQSNDEPSGEQALSVESVKAAQESPAEDFEWTDEDGGAVVTGYNGNGGVVVIPAQHDGMDVVAISDSAFANCSEITAVRLPDTVQKVGSEAFINCTGMKVFVSGASVKRLGSYAFNACINLETVILNEGLETLAEMCFGGVELKELEIPSTVTKIVAAFRAKSAEKPMVIIGTPGSYAEEYVEQEKDNRFLEFKAK